MIGLVIASHGKLAEGLLDAMFMIIGKQEQVDTLILTEGVDPEVFKQDVKEAIKKVDSGKGVLVVLDLFGGTPSKVAGSVAYEGNNIEVVSGVNLPMLLEVGLQRDDMSLEELAHLAVESGKEGVVDVKQWIKERMEDNDN